MLQSPSPPDSQDILILATSKSNGGVIVAGIDPSTGNWVRPVSSAGSHATQFPLAVEHVKPDRDVLFKTLHLTRVPLKQPCPAPPHIEDWILDTSRRPKILQAFNDDQARRFLDAQATGHIPDLLAGKSNSLCLIKPETYELSAEQAGNDLTVRVDFVHDGAEYKRLICNDLKLRSFARGYLINHQATKAVMPLKEFERSLGTCAYLVIGLSRLENGNLWPACLAFHTVPAYPGDIDWGEL